MSMLWRSVIGAVVGAVVGLLMYRFVGCRTGACPLTANPYIAMAIWGVMGFLVASGGK